MNRPLLGACIGIVMIVLNGGTLLAQEHQPTPTAKAATQEPKKFDELITVKAKVDSGLFNVYREEDKYYLEISESLVNRDFLSVTRIAQGAADLRAQMLGYAGDEVNDNVVRFEKGPNNKLFLKQISFSEQSKDSTRQMFRAVTSSNLQPIVAAFDIKAFSKNKDGYLIDVTDYLNGDNDVLFFNSTVKQMLHLGAPQPDKSYIESVRSFSKNTEIKTIKTYLRAPAQGLPPGMIMAAPGGGTITLELNTSLVELPEKPMQPRYSDDRIGYFTVGYTDFDLNPQGIQKVSYIKRWRLEPKPEDVEKYQRGELVEPQKQIVFYIDPATPAKWVPYLIQGVDDWNKAFEQAGFKNAIIAKEAPKNDSTWSLDDASHNAIIYKPSTIPNASGPSISDPRTGEILESHINWYHNVMELLHDWYMIQAGPSDPAARKMEFDDTLMGQLIRFVSSHEVGHTLGLLHNFGSSSTVPVDSLRSKAWVEVHGHTPSIMDYARFNYVAQPEDHVGEAGLFPRIGDYDTWAIEWGYRRFPQFSGPDEEKGFLNQWVIEHQKNKRLWFGSEQLIGADPRDQNEDLGDDAMKAGDYGVKNLQYILPKLEDWTHTSNEGYDNLDRIYKGVLSQFAQYMAHVVRNVGGIYITPKTEEQPGAIFTLTPKDRQQRAVAFLNRQLFTTPDWLLNPEILDKTGEQLSALIGSLQNPILDKLLSAGTVGKLVEAEAGSGSHAYTALDLLRDLKKGIWSELESHTSITVYRRNLQKQYVSDLIKLAGLDKAGPGPALPPGMMMMGGAGHTNSDAASIARAQLKQLQQEIGKVLPVTTDVESKDHLADIADRIKEALNYNKNEPN